MAELHNALRRKRFRVFYLPTVGLATRTIAGFEPLLHCNHPDLGIISPDLLTTLAEETGLIVRLGRWVLIEACRQMIKWQSRYKLDPPLSLSLWVKVSAKQFAEHDFENRSRMGAVYRLDKGGKTRDIIEAAVALAHNLSMEVAALGIEQPSQVAQLSKMWREQVRGYLFGKPRDADAIGALIASYPRWWG